MARHSNSNDERRPLLDREPIEDIEDVIEGNKVNYKVSSAPSLHAFIDRDWIFAQTTGWKSSMLDATRLDDVQLIARRELQAQSF